MGPKKRESWLSGRLSPMTKYLPSGTTHCVVPWASRGRVGAGWPSVPITT